MQPGRQGNDTSNITTALHALSLNHSDSAALSALASASRESPEARKRLANPEALRTLIDVIDTSIGNSVEPLELALRCLGNACADNDDARDVVTSVGFDWAVRILETSDDAIRALVTKVLYNICNEHEDSQQALYRGKVHYRIVQFLASTAERDDPVSDDLAIELLFWITDHKRTLEPALDRPIPAEVLRGLLQLPNIYISSVDTDTFSIIVESVLTFLRDQVVLQQLTSDTHLYAQVFKILTLTSTKTLAIRSAEGSDSEDLKVLQPLETSLIWVLSDCAATAEGEIAVMLCQSKCSYFLSLLQDESLGRSSVLLAASCQELGNLIRNVDPEHWSYLVEGERLDKWLFTRALQATQGAEETLMLHSIAGLLVQLTRASEQVRIMMVDNDDVSLPALELLCRHDTPQVREVGVELLRRLGAVPNNQQRLASLGKEVMTRLKDESQISKAADVNET